jgi:hypothetical protein
VRQLIPVIGFDTRKEADSGIIKTACASSFTQNWHCNETRSAPVMGIKAVGVPLIDVFVGSTAVVPCSVGRIVPRGTLGVLAGKLQEEVNKRSIHAPIKTLREKASFLNSLSFSIFIIFLKPSI